MRVVIRAWYIEVGMTLLWLMSFWPSDSAAFVESFQFEGHNVVVSDLQVAMACFTFEMPCAAANTYVDYIYVNRKFLGMNHEWQLSVLYHELGHIKLGHIAYPWQTIQVFMGSESLVQREIEADLYAARMGHGKHLLYYFEALREVFLLAEGTEVFSLNARIDALKEYYVQNPHL